MSAPNPVGDFAGLDPDYDLGPIHVQWVDLGSGVAGKVHVVWESRAYVWDGVSAWIRMTQPGGSGGGGTSSTFGAAFPTTGLGTPVGFRDNSGNMGWGSLDASGNLKVVTPSGATGLTDTELRASAVPVTIPTPVPVTDNAGSLTVDGTFWQATQPVSAASLPLPTGAATEATLANLLTLAGFQARINTLGQKAMSASTPVVLSSDQSSIPVTGTFWQATQPVSGPLTDTQLRASAVPVTIPVPAPVSDNAGSLTVDAPVGTPVATRLSDGAAFYDATKTGQLPSALVGGRLDANAGAWLGSTAPTVGQKTMANAIPVVIASDQTTLNTAPAAASVLFRGRVSTFRQLGRAGTVGQKILSLHNATGSAVKAYVTYVGVDLYQTVVKAITVAPPIIRLWKVTVLPTNGTALTKNKIGGTTASNASITVLGDSSADGTNSATTLTATLPAGAILAQEFAPRFITAAGYEPADRIEFLGPSGTQVELLALEGVVLELNYTLATQNPVTDMWVATLEWYEI